jgi:signal transduction histidine kinase
VITLEYPPRVRVEWFLAAARVGLAGGALIAVTADVPSPDVHSVLLAYLAYSVSVLALVWSPVKFDRSWGMTLHGVDLATFTALMVVTKGAESPFFITLIYLLVSATIRWHVSGTLWTAAVAAAAFIAASLCASVFGNGAIVTPGVFVIRMFYLIIAAALLAYLGAHQRKYRDELGRLAAWPRTMSREPYAVVSEIMSQAGDLLNAPRIVIVWSDGEEGAVNVAWTADGRVMWKEEPPDTYGALVAPTLIGRTFQVANAARDESRVVVLTRGRFLRRRCRPIDERLRAGFEMRAVQSWPLDGEVVRGRMFCLDKPAPALDELTIGEFVARLATSRLDGLYLLGRLQEARVLEERVRVARDLHDSLLQSQAGAALQLLAARRLLERDPAAGRQRLDEVQQQLEHGELEMRAFIRDLRPARRPVSEAARVPLRERVRNHARRIERQWNVRVTLNIDEAADQMGAKVASDIYRLIHEGLVNAARHANASTIRITVALADGHVTLSIADDGKGFPFTGTYDLAWLERMDQGPVTLRERVAALRGDLTLTSSKQEGTNLRITVPLATA